MADKIIAGVKFSSGESADAFPLGGRVFQAPVAAANPSSLDGVVTGAASLLMISIPAGHVLYVGHSAQVGSLTGDAARAVMFPLPAGVWTVVVTDEAQAVLRLLGDSAFAMPILEAATVGGEA